MQYALAGSGLALVVASVLAWWYRREARGLGLRLSIAESLSRTRLAINQELRERLANALKSVRASVDKEAANDAARAKDVTDPDSAARFLNDLRKDR